MLPSARPLWNRPRTPRNTPRPLDADDDVHSAPSLTDDTMDVDELRGTSPPRPLPRNVSLPLVRPLRLPPRTKPCWFRLRRAFTLVPSRCFRDLCRRKDCVETLESYKTNTTDNILTIQSEALARYDAPFTYHL